MDRREILDMALHVETLAEKIYCELGKLFPEAKPLFERLMYEESRHAVIVTINMGLLALDALPPEFEIDMLPLIRKTLDVARLLEKKISEKDISLAEALDLCIQFEESGCEAYLQEVLRSESTDSGLNYVKRFYEDSMCHAELVRKYREGMESGMAGVTPLAEEGRSKLNCWEYKKCGREPMGAHEGDQGRCPVTVEKRLDGVHEGVAAGRACWVSAGTSCRDGAQGTFARRLRECECCDFYRRVYREECSSFLSADKLLERMKG